MVNAIIADDDKDICMMLSNELNSTKEIKVIEMICDGTKVIPEVKRLRPDILILDLKMPGKNGMQIIEYINRDDTIDTKVIVLSGEPEYITKVRENNCVISYLSKDKFIKESGRIIKELAKEIDSKSLDQTILDYLYDLGYSATHKGTDLLKECIKIYLLKKEYDIKEKELFIIIARRKSTAIYKVKNNIHKSTKAAGIAGDMDHITKKLKLGATEDISPNKVIKMSRYYINGI